MRPVLGQYEQLMALLEQHDMAGFKNYLRMDPAMFYEILERITPRIQKQNTSMKRALEPGMKLAATLRFLATGDCSKDLGWQFMCSNNALCKFLIEVCRAIIAEYCTEAIVRPSTPEGWKQIADLYWKRWNFPHTLGAVDGKHIAIRRPKQSGSEYFNYKKFYSIVLLAVVDADYKFIFMDVGASGSGSDAGLWNTCEIHEKLQNNQLGVPQPEPLPGDEGGQDIPYFMIGDDAFALKPYMMKPLPLRHMTREQRLYNYRLSRARRIVENAFGILASRFRCLLTTMQQDPGNVQIIVACCCILHNLLRMRNPAAAEGAGPIDDDEDIPGSQNRETLPDMEDMNAARNASRMAKEQRDYLVNYISSDAGKVDWQDSMI